MAYELRPHYSKKFRYFSSHIPDWEKLSTEEKKELIFQKCKDIVNFAYTNTVFYHDYYKLNHFSPDTLHSFSDLMRIPVVNKKILSNVPLELRSSKCSPRFYFNTGGSSGTPFGFYEDCNLGPKEWAHLIYMWQKSEGFSTNMTRLRLTGRSNIRNKLNYYYFQNVIDWDIYSEFHEVADVFKDNYYNIPPVRFLHGYPSALYELALYCEKDSDFCALLKKNLKGILLCSEFPYKLWRNKIESVFGKKTFSFYGHTEACILAGEDEKMERYFPLSSYGWAETLSMNGEECHLVGTDYYNFASPLIRYDTEDLVEQCEYDSDLLTSFQIKNGRAGQFIHDWNNKKIALTGLIFGRHHKLFDYCSNIQIAEVKPGNAIVFYVLKKSEENLENAGSLFNAENVNIQFEFQKIPSPIRTKSGKVHLLVSVNKNTANDNCETL